MDKKRILIVDDEPYIVKGLATLLRSQHYDVLTAMDGMQATNLAMKQRPDLILLDIGMPAGDGHVVAERIRNSTTVMDVPIIFLTARQSADDRQRAIAAGADRYITKPFDPDELLATIDEVFGRSFNPAG